MSEMKIIYDTSYGNPCWSATKTLAMNKLKWRRDVYLNGGNNLGNNGKRKKRNTDYSMTQRLLKNLGEGRVVELWTKYGMYRSAELLSIEMQEYVSPYVLRYMSNKYYWQRSVNKLSPIYKGVLAGTIPAAYYKHLIFPEEVQNNGE